MTNVLTPTTDLGMQIAARAEGKSGGIRQITEGRSDVHRINPFLIKVQDGFNVRDFDSDTVSEHIDSLAKSIAEVGVRRPLTVRNKGGELLLKDGECRLRATIRAIEVYGAEVYTVPVILADRSESDADATLGILVENSGLPVTPLGKAEVVKRLKGFGWSNGEIAARAGMSEGRVGQLLDLCGLSEEVKDMIRNETVSSTVALEVARRNDWNDAETAKELKTAQSKVAAKGKKRVTAKAISAPKPIELLANIFSNAGVQVENDDGDDDNSVLIALSLEDWLAACALLKIESNVVLIDDETETSDEVEMVEEAVA